MSSILFRCDASAEVGAGHLMRCLALADLFVQFGWKATFAVNPSARNTMCALGASGHEIIDVNKDAHAMDLARLNTRAVVIDNYDYDSSYEKYFAGDGRTVVVFDDLANRPHDCDILVDPTPYRRPADYAPFVSNSCRMLLGPESAITRSSWRKDRVNALARLSKGGSVERILVSMGATDPVNATGRVLDAIEKCDFKGQVDVVLGSGAPHIREISKRSSARVVLHVEPDDLCEIAACADLAIGSSGSSCFERAVLGLPSLVIPTAENQRYLAASFSALGAAKVLPVSMLDSPRNLAREIDLLILDSKARVKMTEAAATLCDGRGALRLLTAVAGYELIEDVPVQLRVGEKTDILWLFDLQRQPLTRRYARNPDLPNFDEHTGWFERVLNNTDRFLAIVSAGDVSVGMVRLDRVKDLTFEVSIAIHENYLGCGFGRAGLNLLRRLAPGADLIATIHPENVASINVFTAAGYLNGLNGYMSKANHE